VVLRRGGNGNRLLLSPSFSKITLPTTKKIINTKQKQTKDSTNFQSARGKGCQKEELVVAPTLLSRRVGS